MEKKLNHGLNLISDRGIVWEGTVVEGERNE
jgi:hypothetical protein